MPEAQPTSIGAAVRLNEDSPVGAAARLQPPDRLESCAVLHSAALVIGAAWAFGGNTDWARLALSAWGSLGVLLGIRAWLATRRSAIPVPLHWLWPLAAFDLLVLVSLFNPSYRAVQNGAQTVFVESVARWSALPSSARPDISFNALWFFNVAYLSGFNLVLAVRHRRSLRLLLAVLTGNALVLAVFGTFQKLIGAKGLYFGLQRSPQPFFFGPFIYHNHWGAFTLLMIALGLALVFHFAARRSSRDFWHSPALAVLVCVLLLATTVPLSTSRSSTALVLVLLLTAGAYGLGGMIRRRRRFGESIVPPVALVAATAVAATAFIYVLARPIIAVRLENTHEQLQAMRAHGEYLPRQVLYRDTWNLARDRLWFGWGMGSYPTAFYTRNTQYYSSDGPNRVFEDAHSDWLQSVAEVGIVGTTLLGLCALVPLSALRRSGVGAITAFPLAGCGLIVLYALLEFPFGNRAVVCAFWLCFFVALQYARLNRRYVRAV